MTSSGIGYWYGVNSDNMFNNGFTPVPRITTTSDIDLLAAQTQIETLKAQLSSVSTSEYSIDNKKLQPLSINYSGDYTQEYTSPTKITTTDTILDSTNNTEIENNKKTIEDRSWQAQNNIHMSNVAIEGITLAINQYSILNTSIADVQCTSSLCTADFIHSDKSGHYSLLQNLTSIKQFSRGFVVKTDNNENNQTTVIYFPYSEEFLPL